MRAEMKKLQKKYNGISISDIERVLVYVYLWNNGILYTGDVYFEKFFQDWENIDKEIIQYVKEKVQLKNIDNLINAFEFLISDTEKKGKGMVYTPLNIKQYIVEHTILSETIPCVVDPACGCGSFLITAIQWMHKKYRIDISKIIQNYIKGFDIDKHSIEKAETLLNVLCIQEEGKSFGKIKGLRNVNALDEFSKMQYENKYDVVIGNPPYVRAKNIEPNIKLSLKNWSVVSGNVDLYIPFYQLACNILKKDGVLGFISPNTFLQSVNGRALRNYFVEKGYEITILDFREAQAFEEITHYTCICIIEKARRTHSVKYALLNGKRSLVDYEFTDYDLLNYERNQEWRFGDKSIDRIIKKIESQPHKLNDYKIRNGLATLSNEIFFFAVAEEDETYFYRQYEGEKYPIEKAICIDVAKPNVMRTEDDLKMKMEKAIFPYDVEHKIIAETMLQEKFPMAYAFLHRYKEQLLQRDKGKAKNYSAWYAYGRTQGMNNQGKKLLIPYMAERGVAIKCNRGDVLFYCGYALFCNDDKMLEVLKRIIESNVFWYYIENTSKPYAKGYMALAKNYIKNFGLPEISEKQKEKLITISVGEERERMISELYGIPYVQEEPIP